jgi:F0F1-type ATP synthase assembly protein I
MKSSRKKALKIYSVVSSFIFEIIITVALSFIIGYYLDLWLHTVVVFKIIFILIGVFAGIRNLILRVNKVEETPDEKL